VSTTHGQWQVTKGERADPEPGRFLTSVDLCSGEHALGEARDRLGVWLRRIGVRGEEYWEILTAAGEACANSFEHSGATVDDRAWVEGRLHGRTLDLVIGDTGRWREPDPIRSAAEQRGRGRLMMTELMDTMSISPGPHGTVVRLSKRLVSLPPAAPTGEPARPATRRHARRRQARAHAT
jgi:anti-sigma regulatory factor (Ser/Thr protein kinase)